MIKTLIFIASLMAMFSDHAVGSISTNAEIEFAADANTEVDVVNADTENETDTNTVADTESETDTNTIADTKDETETVAEPEISTEEELLGRWEGAGYLVKEGTGSSMDGMKWESTGEWIEFDSDSRGIFFILKEFPFEYSVEEDNTILIKEDAGPSFEGKIENGELILDNGPMLYYFTKGKVSADTEAVEESEPEAMEVPEPVKEPEVTEASEPVKEPEVTEASEPTTEPEATETPETTKEAELTGQPKKAETEEESEKYAYVYSSISCTVNGENYFAEGEGMVLYPDGTGIVRFRNTNYDIEWALEDDIFTFKDESGDSFKGRVSGNTVVGKYTIKFDDGNVKEYKYVYETSNIVAVPTEDARTYEVLSCTENGKNAYVSGEKVIFYSNGTGIVRFGESEYDIIWFENGENITFMDGGGGYFEGTMDEELLIGVFKVLYKDGSLKDFKYVYSLAAEENV